MEIVRARSGVPLRLTEERWEHISTGHPEMSSMRPEILETVADPDLIQEGDSGELLAIRRYPETPLTSKFLVVPYREVSEEDGFVLTAYLARRPAQWRSVRWKR